MKSISFIDGVLRRKWDRKPCPMCFFHGSADPTVTFDMERNPNRMRGAGGGPRP